MTCVASSASPASPPTAFVPTRPEELTPVTLGGDAAGGAVALADDALGLIGTSPAMARLRADIRRAALSTRPVLVCGPTGAGKELVAAALAHLGGRGNLVDINCGAIPEPLMESQLFGHEKGAFTDARNRHDGFLTEVGDGTLFLDEVGELPLSLQTKLLRVLENQRFCRVGSCKALEFRGRVVAATHVDLARSVELGTFRRDLYFRLNVIKVAVPALDDHREDVPLLIAHFCRRERRTLQLTPPALRLLVRRSWPGNVRELRNVVERLLCHPSGQTLGTEQVAEALDERPTQHSDQEALASHVRALLDLQVAGLLRATIQALVQEALCATGHNKSAAAIRLGVHRKVVERLARRGALTGDDAAAEPEAVEAG
jgi:DNA-binding NtrC family response regulator